MRQLTYTGASAVEWREAPDARLESSTDVVVRPLAVARCDLDTSMVTADIFPGPFGVGHECVAEVVDIGDAVVSLAPGDRVVVPYQLSCGRCRPCGMGRFAACAEYRGPAGAMFGFGAAGGGHGGALADLLRVPAADHLLEPVTAPLSDELLATLPDNVVDGYRCVRELRSRAHDSDVLICGGQLRSIGLYAAGWAMALGAAEVRYHDTDPARCEAARALGAAATVITEWPRRFAPAELTVDASGELGGLLATIHSTAPFGHATIASIYFGGIPNLPQLEMYTRGITVHTSRADSRRYLDEVAGYAVAGTFDPLAVDTTVVAWDDAAERWLEPALKLVASRSAT